MRIAEILTRDFIARLKETKKKMRVECSKEIGASASGILLREQSTPRHKDLKAGIWMRAIRRAPQSSHILARRQAEVIHRYSPPR
jgi:hypothetical protein